MSQFVNFHDDVNTLPPTAEIRGAQGPFFSPEDVMRYLGTGTLLTLDEAGNPITSPLVNVLARYDDFWDDTVYDVYIDEGS